jgi:hypothetical protein
MLPLLYIAEEQVAIPELVLQLLLVLQEKEVELEVVEEQ